MHELICPHCDKAFKIDETGYAEILKQVRDADFDKQLHERLELAEREKEIAVELAQAKVDRELQKAVSERDSEIQSLMAKLDAEDVRRKLAVSEAVSSIEKEREALSRALEKTKQERDSAAQLAEAKRMGDLQQAAAVKDAEIKRLQAELAATDITQKLALVEAVQAVTKERDELQSGLDRAELEKQLAEAALKDKYETQLEDRNSEILRLREMKARLSTKMIGETLEQHCEVEFNRLRATAFPKAYFEKDNDARTGSKGDYIFRDVEDGDIEIVSIMFEMKNEGDETATKRRTRTSSGNWIRIATKRAVSTQFWCLCLNPTVSFTTLASLMCFTDTRRCMWSGRNSSSLSSRCCATRQ